MTFWIVVGWPFFKSNYVDTKISYVIIVEFNEMRF